MTHIWHNSLNKIWFLVKSNLEIAHIHDINQASIFKLINSGKTFFYIIIYLSYKQNIRATLLSYLLDPDVDITHP